MGLLSSLFGKKTANDSRPFQQTIMGKDKHTPTPTPTPKLHLKGKQDANGLYPSELVMLAVAERFTISETNYPKYLTYTYEIVNPLKVLQVLQERGFLEVGSSKDSLLNFKLTELKDIATALNVATTGKKAEIIERLSGMDEEKLNPFVMERMWKLTPKGQDALKANPYIQFFLEKHKYNLFEVGVNIWTVNEEFLKNSKLSYRDIIYSQLNKQMNIASIKFQKDPMSGTESVGQYCNCYRIMGLFIEEEKSYVNASDMYFQYLFKRINIQAGLQLLKDYKLYNYDKKLRNNIIERYYDDIQLYPFHKTEILRLLDELNISGDDVRNALITSFERTNDSGVMTVQEAADFIILELSGDVAQSKDLAYKLARKAVKKVL